MQSSSSWASARPTASEPKLLRYVARAASIRSSEKGRRRWRAKGSATEGQPAPSARADYSRHGQSAALGQKPAIIGLLDAGASQRRLFASAVMAEDCKPGSNVLRYPNFRHK